MRQIILIIIGVLAILAVPCMVEAAEGKWRDPFACDPYVFEFDIPLVQEGPIAAPLIIRSTYDQQQSIQVSMWPEYSDARNVAPSEWFTIEPMSAPLPAGGMALFNIILAPPSPLEDYDGMTYYTYIRVSRVLEGGTEYWERPLPVRIRYGSAIPSILYAVEGWKIGRIVGKELTRYTQDQITLRVSNRSNLSDLYVALYPVTPSPPGTDDIGSSDPEFNRFATLWRDQKTLSIYAEPVGEVNPETGVYDEYMLYYGPHEFGRFLAASYSRADDRLEMSIYPYRIGPKGSADVPFVLQVYRNVPSGIYRLQIHVAPVGGYSPGNIGIQYESKLILEVKRGEPNWLATAHNVVGWIILSSLLAMLVIAVVNYVITGRHKEKEVIVDRG